MKVLTYHDAPLEIAERWKSQYFNNGIWSECKKGNSEEMYKSLIDAKTTKDVEEIIGNTSWTTKYCDSCEENSTKDHVRFKDGVTICTECLENASVLLEHKRNKTGIK